MRTEIGIKSININAKKVSCQQVMELLLSLTRKCGQALKNTVNGGWITVECKAKTIVRRLLSAYGWKGPTNTSPMWNEEIPLCCVTQSIDSPIVQSVCNPFARKVNKWMSFLF